APTKKSNALSKNAWLYDQDQRLRDLYDENRLHEDCLSRIQEEFNGRSRNAIIKRMIALGLIADRSEILPRKAKKPKKKTKSGGRSDDSDDEKDSSDNSSDDETKKMQSKRPKKQSKPRKPAGPQKTSVVKVPFKSDHLKTLLSELSESLKSVLPWLQESLSDAAEDIEDTPNDADNGVPLVPFTQDQNNAMEDENFKFFLTALGIQPPVEQMETYWRIPVYFTAGDINLRLQLLSGELDEEDDEQMGETTLIDNDEVVIDPIVYSTDDDNEEEENGTPPRENPKVNNLIYNDSDNDDGTQRTPMKRNVSIERKKEKTKKKFDIFDMIQEPESEDIVMQSQELRNRLATLVDSDDSDNDTVVGTKSINKSHRSNAIIDSDSEDETENTVLNSSNDTTTKSMAMTTLDSHFESSAFDGNHSSHNIGINVSDDVNATRNNKRERSESDESMVDGEIVVGNKRARKLVSRRAVIDDDDD
ncbi:Protein timeless like, partial [Pseudolycoriella hygida]